MLVEKRNDLLDSLEELGDRLLLTPQENGKVRSADDLHRGVQQSGQLCVDCTQVRGRGWAAGCAGSPPLKLELTSTKRWMK